MYLISGLSFYKGRGVLRTLSYVCDGTFLGKAKKFHITLEKSNIIKISVKKDKFPFFFSIWVFFHVHSRFIGQQGKGEAIC